MRKIHYINGEELNCLSELVFMNTKAIGLDLDPLIIIAYTAPLLKGAQIAKRLKNIYMLLIIIESKELVVLRIIHFYLANLLVDDGDDVNFKALKNCFVKPRFMNNLMT